MADFSTPFAQNGPRRAPTTQELESGFASGAADKLLFNYLMWAMSGEIGNVMSQAGVTPNENNLSGLYEAISALIDSASGAGDVSTYLLTSQARSRLPIYPGVSTASGLLGVTAPVTGTIRVPSGVDFTHRGIHVETTTEEDFATAISRTYHLRWNPTDGFALKDLTDVSYNPSVLAEDNVAFDSTYDDMLVARVVTNGSNVATITELKNSPSLSESFSYDEGVSKSDTAWGTISGTDEDINWARTPSVETVSMTGVQVSSASFTGSAASVGLLRKAAVRAGSLTRYSASEIEYVYEDDGGSGVDAGRIACNRLLMSV